MPFGELAMDVSLTAELKRFVNAKVQSGRYNSASEVVREAPRFLEEYEQARAAQLSEFNKELGRRLAALDRGEHVDPEEARARLHASLTPTEKARMSGYVLGAAVVSDLDEIWDHIGSDSFDAADRSDRQAF